MNQPLWYPYCQMNKMEEHLEVRKAKGVYLELDNGSKLIDAISSWWCVIHGYNHPAITEVAKQQLNTLPHVMMGGLTHKPAKKLAEILVSITPEKLNHVFYGDSGSVGVEIALKMAIQYWKNMGRKKYKFISLAGAYHGDTFAAMSVADTADSMHAKFSDVLPKQFRVSPPYVKKSGSVDITPALKQLENILTNNSTEIAAMIVEPVLQGAGGFKIYDPKFLNVAYEMCKKHDVLMIFDEVATGFGRTGKLFAAEYCNVSPDIMVLGKGITAGYMGLSATLATSEIFQGFYGASDYNAFMHGPTFMGNPTACAIALSSIALFKKENCLERIKEIEALLKKHLLPLENKNIKEVRVLGASAVIEAKTKSNLMGVQEFAKNHGVWLRPFEKYLYTAPPYVISDEELMQIINVMKMWFENKDKPQFVL